MHFCLILITESRNRKYNEDNDGGGSVRAGHRCTRGSPEFYIYAQAADRRGGGTLQQAVGPSQPQFFPLVNWPVWAEINDQRYVQLRHAAFNGVRSEKYPNGWSDAELTTVLSARILPTAKGWSIKPRMRCVPWLLEEGIRSTLGSEDAAPPRFQRNRRSSSTYVQKNPDKIVPATATERNPTQISKSRYGVHYEISFPTITLLIPIFTLSI